MEHRQPASKHVLQATQAMMIPGMLRRGGFKCATVCCMLQVRIVQKLTLAPLEQRLACIQGAGYNTFLLQNADVFLDMLTDSGA
jgi:hypothetical protein